MRARWCSLHERTDAVHEQTDAVTDAARHESRLFAGVSDLLARRKILRVRRLNVQRHSHADEQAAEQSNRVVRHGQSPIRPVSCKQCHARVLVFLTPEAPFVSVIVITPHEQTCRMRSSPISRIRCDLGHTASALIDATNAAGEICGRRTGFPN